jgi:16S rRNA processing protein RimM
VELASGGQQPLLIPFVQAIVPSVHLEEGWIGITPPPGLLELADPREPSDPPPRS